MFDVNNIMKEFLKSEKTKISDVVEYKGNYYFVDSCYTLDHGYETMIFPCTEEGNVTNWTELYCDIYDTETEMVDAHKAIVADITQALCLD